MGFIPRQGLAMYLKLARHVAQGGLQSEIGLQDYATMAVYKMFSPSHVLLTSSYLDVPE